MELNSRNIETHEVSAAAQSFYDEFGGNYSYIDIALRERKLRYDETFLLDLLVLALREAKSKNTCVRLLSSYRRLRQRSEDAYVNNKVYTTGDAPDFLG